MRLASRRPARGIRAHFNNCTRRPRGSRSARPDLESARILIGASGRFVSGPTPLSRNSAVLRGKNLQTVDAYRNNVRGPSVGATDIPQRSITGLLGTGLVGADDCDCNDKANRTSSMQVGLYPNAVVAASDSRWTPVDAHRGSSRYARLAPRTALLLSIWLRLVVARALLAVALACQDRLDSLLLTWFQIESVPLNFLDNFLLQDLTLEAPQRVFQSLTIPNLDLGQQSPPIHGRRRSFMLTASRPAVVLLEAAKAKPSAPIPLGALRRLILRHAGGRELRVSAVNCACAPAPSEPDACTLH
jgi:hypothetical protein